MNPPRFSAQATLAVCMVDSHRYFTGTARQLWVDYGANPLAER